MPVYGVSLERIDSFIKDFRKKTAAEQSGSHVVRIYEGDFNLEQPDAPNPLVAIMLLGPLTEKQINQVTRSLYAVRRS